MTSKNKTRGVDGTSIPASGFAYGPWLFLFRSRFLRGGFFHGRFLRGRLAFASTSHVRSPFVGWNRERYTACCIRKEEKTQYVVFDPHFARTKCGKGAASTVEAPSLRLLAAAIEPMRPIQTCRRSSSPHKRHLCRFSAMLAGLSHWWVRVVIA